MDAYDLKAEQHFDPRERVEKVLTTAGDGDATVACWLPGQISPYHCHPFAIEIYFCFEGGGTMRTPDDEVDVVPGAFVVHPPGEFHEYANGAHSTLLFRVRYGSDLSARAAAWRGMSDWQPSESDTEYLRGLSDVPQPVWD